MCDDIDSPSANAHLNDFIFPCGTLEELLRQRGYGNVQVEPSGDHVYGYDVHMNTPEPVERQAIRQVLADAVAQIPASAIARVSWRTTSSAIVVDRQQVAAQIVVAYLQNAH